MLLSKFVRGEEGMKNEKGFTLVELLIVIVVIGILSALMMLSSREAINSSKVTKLINDLQMAKNAALAYYSDHYSEFRINHVKAIDKNEVKKYINSNLPDWDKYTFVVIYFGKEEVVHWFVRYSGGELNNSEFCKKLAGHAEKQKLWDGSFKDNFDNYKEVNNLTFDDAYFKDRIYKSTANSVALQIR